MPRCAHKVKNSGTVDDYDWYLHLHLISPTSDILHEGALPPLKYDIRVRRRSDVTILCEPNTIRLAGSCNAHADLTTATPWVQRMIQVDSAGLMRDWVRE